MRSAASTITLPALAEPRSTRRAGRNRLGAGHQPAPCGSATITLTCPWIPACAGPLLASGSIATCRFPRPAGYSRAHGGPPGACRPPPPHADRKHRRCAQPAGGAPRRAVSSRVTAMPCTPSSVSSASRRPERTPSGRSTWVRSPVTTMRVPRPSASATFSSARRGILRFIKNCVGVCQRAAAHERQRRDLDLAVGETADHLLSRHHVVQRVVQRPQIGIHLLLHVAGQEAETLTGLDCRARQARCDPPGRPATSPPPAPPRDRSYPCRQALCRTPCQTTQALRCRSPAQDCVVLTAPAAGPDGWDIGQWQARIGVGIRQPNCRFHVRSSDASAALEPPPQALQRRLCRIDTLRLAGNGDAVAPAGQAHPVAPARCGPCAGRGHRAATAAACCHRSEG